MNPNRDHSTSHPADAIEPAVGAAGSAADELLTHGLLTFIRIDDRMSQERRVQGALKAVSREQPAGGWRISRAALRAWAAAAAVVLIAGAIAYTGLPGERSAQAMVQESIHATRTSGDRRYEVHAMLTGETELEQEPHAVVDTSDAGQLLIRGVRPDGVPVIVGRDAQGKWALRVEGGIDRSDPERAWPRWAVVGKDSLFAESIDGLLERMAGMYELKRSSDEKLTDRGERLFHRVEGVRKLRVWGPGPATFVMWLDQSTKVVERIELRWVPPPPDVEGAGDPPPPQGGADGDPRASEELRGGSDRDVPPGDGRAGSGTDQPDDGPPPPRRLRRGEGDPDRGRGPGRGPDGRPAHPPGGPMGMMMDPMGPLGMLRDPMIHPRPGRGMPRPQLLVIERVEAPAFRPDWFSPESHEQAR